MTTAAAISIPMNSMRFSGPPNLLQCSIHPCRNCQPVHLRPCLTHSTKQIVSPSTELPNLMLLAKRNGPRNPKFTLSYTDAFCIHPDAHEMAVERDTAQTLPQATQNGQPASKRPNEHVTAQGITVYYKYKKRRMRCWPCWMNSKMFFQVPLARPKWNPTICSESLSSRDENTSKGRPKFTRSLHKTARSLTKHLTTYISDSE
jgi:hypothetical protein